MKLTDFDTLFVDLDGVIWLEGRPIKDNIVALKRFIEGGGRVFIVTNNSTRSRKTYAFLLSKLGLEINEEHIVTSSHLVAEYIASKSGIQPVFPLGESGLIEELSNRGHIVLTNSEWMYATYVAVGLDRNLTYEKASSALKAVINGATLVAANKDEVLPTPQGPSLGAGGIVSLLEASSGVKAVITVGKPSRFLAEYLLGKAGRGIAAFVGDKISTDMQQAKLMGLPGILVGNEAIRKHDENVPANVYRVESLLELV